ncbi:iron export ABC transporter permease subunit FetB [uncultured Clostridium sp.]|jgi:putative ABC transport system permease protein|uniref:ABC transporter permease n=1 Tax=uncultured Clostridium sp. TaxID=59620 RepID=UPI002602BC6D|nr:iron export ABC transporter permease subunit FetB [uncultured Clostridium sp.]
MEIKSLAFASLLLVIPIYISNREKLGLGKDIIISIVRAIIQLVAVGYILKYIFAINNKAITVVLIIIMIINAAVNTRKRGKGIKNVFWISFLALLVSTSVTLTVLVLSGAIKFNPDEMIPISGMIISQAMVAVGLSYRTLISSFDERKAEIEAKLSLGADIGEASKEIIRKAIKFAMSPNIDSAKTLGIVSLPGMMTGLILGGASPMEAIKFQIMVTFMMMSASSLSIIIATYISYKSFFNERKQLVYSN